MNKADIGQSFLNHEPIAGVKFEHNDYVHIIGGMYVGKSGSLVAVSELGPEPLFIIELDGPDYPESGCDVEVLQSEIKLATP